MKSIFLLESKGIEFNIKGKMASKEGQITIETINVDASYMYYTLDA